MTLENIEIKKERNYLFDNMKVILIFFVVSAHFIRVGGGFEKASFGGMYYIISFAFIMQGFIFVSGYFSKNTQKCRNGAVKNFLVPYFVLMPIMYLCRLMLFGHASLDFTKPTHALWFMLVMFAYRILIKDLAKIPGIVAITAGIMLVSGFFDCIGTDYALGRILTFMVFFVIGFKLEWKHIEKIRKIPTAVCIIILIALLVFTYFAAYTEYIPLDMWLVRDSYAANGLGNVEGLVIRIIIEIVSTLWIILIINFTPNKKIFFTSVGQSTITIYVLHVIVRYVIKRFGLPGDMDILTYVSAFAITFIVMYVFSRPAVHNSYTKFMDFIYEKIVLSPIHLYQYIAKKKEK